MKKDPIKIFRNAGGQLRMSEAIRLGMTRYMLYSLKEKGIIEQISRGLYRLAELPPLTSPDLVSVSMRFPIAVICLVSALSFHEITTQIPHEINVAVPVKARVPTSDFPPVKAFHFSDATYNAGIEEYLIDGVKIKVYSPEKTIADCFKFRNKLGIDIVLEALKLYRARKEINYKKMLEFAKICRIEKVIMPYLEASM